MIHILLALLPVSLFLILLRYSDTFKLVAYRDLTFAIVYGAAMAGAAYWLNNTISESFELDFRTLATRVAPFTEEILKSLLMVYLLATRRVGFIVDAAIYGFAIGAGFALVENIYYLNALEDADLSVWIVRGFGTAIMHGGTTTMMAVLAKMGTYIWQHRFSMLASIALGLAAAVLFHFAFNTIQMAPILKSMIIVIFFPPFMTIAYMYSEKKTQQWIGVGLDKDAELLELLMKGDLPSSQVGIYLNSLRVHFQGPIMADIINYLRLHLEISAKVKGMMIMKQYGLEPEPDPSMAEILTELDFLKKSIGVVGIRAMRPLLSDYDKELWQFKQVG
jgi:protease PrsW